MELIQKALILSVLSIGMAQDAAMLGCPEPPRVEMIVHAPQYERILEANQVVLDMMAEEVEKNHTVDVIAENIAAAMRGTQQLKRTTEASFADVLGRLDALTTMVEALTNKPPPATASPWYVSVLRLLISRM
eukprot:GHVO01000596.1.p1 GENE.GHVO01000596.1~~GHVO01000596.1.p1  ORF type:complete len:132 (-),score=16.81 GHVO01000596.1:99-494(-)